MGSLDAAAPERQRGVRRVVSVWRLFRAERENPAPFYRLLAAELVDDLERRYGPLARQRVLDLGCGPGWYAEALRA
ncbi:MAG: SAM-dependent methyltransferase, partial [Acidimicrobiales bacterium]